MIIIISGPSGSGQDSIIEALQKELSLERVITTTTRAMRPGEEQGKPYYFTSEEEFKARLQNNEFFEWAQEYNNCYYGVTGLEMLRAGGVGKTGIWKVDYKGVINAKKIVPGIPAILILAPLDQLERRLRERDKHMDEKYFQERMEYTREWLEHIDIYDRVIDNSDGKLKEAVEEAKIIIKKFLD